MGSIYAEHNQPAQALRHYLHVARLAEQIKQPSLATSAYNAAVTVCKDRKKAIVFSAWHTMSAQQNTMEIAYNADSLALPNSMQGVKLDLLVSNVKAEQRAVELDVLSRQYWQEQASSLRTKVWLIATLAGLLVVVLLLLYGRQRLRSRAKTKYIEGLESERGRIAKELHDGVCNDLLALELNLQHDSTQKPIELLRTVRNQVRMLSHELMPPMFQYATIDEILLDYTSHLELPSGVEVVFAHHTNRSWGEINHALAFQIYRMTHELVGNSIKHAQASKTTVTLTQVNKQVRLVVADNGVGFAPNETELRTVKERAASLGGSLHITGTPNGTSIEFTYTHHGHND